MQEGEREILPILIITVGAILAQLPGFFFAELHRQINRIDTSIFVVSAFAIAVISLLTYTANFLAGQAPPVEYAAQMHLFRIPIVLIIFAFATYFITGLIWAILKLTHRIA